MTDYLLMAFVMFAYWELTGIFVYAWMHIRAWIERVDVRQLNAYPEFFKSCLILGPITIFIVVWCEIKGLIQFIKSRKQ